MRHVLAVCLSVAVCLTALGVAPIQGGRFVAPAEQGLLAQASDDKKKPDTVIIRGSGGKVTDVKKKPREKDRKGDRKK